MKTGSRFPAVLHSHQRSRDDYCVEVQRFQRWLAIAELAAPESAKAVEAPLAVDIAPAVELSKP